MRPEGIFPSPEEVKKSRDRLVWKIKESDKQECAIRVEAAKRQKFVSFCKYVAVACISVCFTLGLRYLVNQEPTAQYVELDMESGPRMGHMTLPDGTKIILNASSRLKFPDRFDKDLREVYLDGEAYFDVAKNEKAPFIVHTNKQKVSVLGTQVDIMDYAVDDYFITTLITGKVNIQTLDATGKYSDPVFMQPNQQFFYNTQTGHQAISSVKLDPQRTWVNKIYHFRNEPLVMITSRLEKLYGIKIMIRNEELKKQNLPVHSDWIRSWMKY
ncbi:MAG: FecR family protein [Tannerellaceae bacterium]|nr:FecR family protein [Tannerellaceae bacterium]